MTEFKGLEFGQVFRDCDEESETFEKLYIKITEDDGVCLCGTYAGYIITFPDEHKVLPINSPMFN